MWTGFRAVFAALAFIDCGRNELVLPPSTATFVTPARVRVTRGVGDVVINTSEIDSEGARFCRGVTGTVLSCDVALEGAVP